MCVMKLKKDLPFLKKQLSNDRYFITLFKIKISLNLFEIDLSLLVISLIISFIIFLSFSIKSLIFQLHMNNKKNPLKKFYG